MQRIAVVLAVVTLMGGPVAGAICAITCATAQTVDQSVTEAASHHDGMPAGHHPDAAPSHKSRSGNEQRSNVAATGCDTHRTPDGDAEATLTAGRSDTYNPSAVAALLFDRASLTLAPVLRASSGHSPPLDISLASIPLVLRI